jgi:hypothetical protein
VILFFMGAVALDMTNRRWLAIMRYRLAIYASFGTMRIGMLMALGEWLVGLRDVNRARHHARDARLRHVIIGQLHEYFPGLQATWHRMPAARTIGLVFLLLLALQIPSFVQLSRASLLSLIRNPTESRYVWHRLLLEPLISDAAGRCVFRQLAVDRHDTRRHCRGARADGGTDVEHHPSWVISGDAGAPDCSRSRSF